MSMDLSATIRKTLLLSTTFTSCIWLIGCGSPSEASAIPITHPAANEPSELPHARELVYSVSRSLAELLARVNEKLSPHNTSLSPNSRVALSDLRESLVADIEFAIPFTSPEIDHPDQIQVLRYLMNRQREHTSTFVSIP